MVPELYEKLERLIRFQDPSAVNAAAVLAKGGCPSASIAILDYGRITAHCISSVGDNVDTVFQACSISKPIAGMAVMKLVQQGVLDLAEPIPSYLPKSVVDSLADTEAQTQAVKSITLEHLLSHTAGLNIDHVPGYAGTPAALEDIVAGRHPSNTTKIRSGAFPGQEFDYSGGGFVLIQLILQSVTRRSLSDVVKELVFDPLEMTRSFYGPPAAGANYAKAHFTGYTRCDVEFNNVPEEATAGLWTTPTDLLKAVLAMQKSLVGSQGTSEPYLSKQLAVRMLTQVQNIMGLSWMAPKSPGTAFGHTGSNDPGWRCTLSGTAPLPDATEKLPDYLRECGICVMTNSVVGHDTMFKISSAVLYFQDWPLSLIIHGTAFDHMSWTDTLDNHSEEAGSSVNRETQLSGYAASWWAGNFEGGWQVEINVEGNAPTLKFQAKGGRVVGPLKLSPLAMPQDSSGHNPSRYIGVHGLNLILQLEGPDSGVGRAERLVVWSTNTGTRSVHKRLD